MINTIKNLTLRSPFLVLRHFPHNFVTYFYRGECARLFYCHEIAVS